MLEKQLQQHIPHMVVYQSREMKQKSAQKTNKDLVASNWHHFAGLIPCSLHKQGSFSWSEVDSTVENIGFAVTAGCCTTTHPLKFMILNQKMLSKTSTPLVKFQLIESNVGWLKDDEVV